MADTETKTTETKTTGAKSTGMSRWQRGLLVGSLALNLLVVGVVAGSAIVGGGPKGQQRFDLTVGPLTRAMDAEHRDAVRDALRDSGAFARNNRADIRADMQLLFETLRADDFDEAQFRAAMTRQRARLQSGQDAILDAVSQQVADMSVQERQDFADRLQEQLRRGPQRRN